MAAAVASVAFSTWVWGVLGSGASRPQAPSLDPGSTSAAEVSATEAVAVAADSDAAEAHFRGLYQLHQGTPEALHRARSAFEHSLALDPDPAVGHAALARTFNAMVFSHLLTPEEGFPRARRAALAALERDPDTIDALISLGEVHLYFELDPVAAEGTLRRAVALAPEEPRIHGALAAVAAASQRPAAAVEAARRARGLDPLDLSVSADLCWYLLYADDYAGALAECRRALELEPGHRWTLLGLSEALLALGREGEAAEALRGAFAASEAPPSTPPATVAGFWARVATHLEETGRGGPMLAAVASARAERAERAIGHLRRAVVERSFWLPFVHVEPRLDPLRQRPDFRQLVAGLPLPEPVGGDQVAQQVSSLQ